MFRLVAATANRLRLMQIDFAEESPATRQEYLLGELKSALAQVSINERRAFLEALADRFPTWDAAAAAGPVPAAAALPPRELDVPELCSSLADKGRNLDEGQRREIIERLRSAWGLPAAGPAVFGPIPAELSQIIGLAESDKADVNCLPYVFKMLLEFVNTLDPLVIKAWSTLRPNASVRKTDWQKAVARFVRGEKNATLSRDLLELRQLAGALIGTLPQLPYRFCEQHLARFRPENIEEAIKEERGGFLVGQEARCWRKFAKDLAPALEESAVQQAISQIVIDCVESYKNAANRPTGE